MANKVSLKGCYTDVTRTLHRDYRDATQTLQVLYFVNHCFFSNINNTYQKRQKSCRQLPRTWFFLSNTKNINARFMHYFQGICCQKHFSVSLVRKDPTSISKGGSALATAALVIFHQTFFLTPQNFKVKNIKRSKYIEVMQDYMVFMLTSNCKTCKI